MKYLRTFEDISDKPKEGDYVLMRANLSLTNTNSNYYKQLLKYLSNNFGQIKNSDSPFGLSVYSKSEYDDESDIIVVKYYNIPEEIMNWFRKNPFQKNSGYRRFNIDRIVEFAPTEEELKLKLSAKKFNL